MNMNEKTRERLFELRTQEADLHKRLDDYALTRQRLLDDMWELEDQTTALRKQFRTVTDEITKIYDNLHEGEL